MVRKAEAFTSHDVLALALIIGCFSMIALRIETTTMTNVLLTAAGFVFGSQVSGRRG